MEAGIGDLPPGLAVHTAATSDDGLMVIEVWDSREAADQFMTSRLGPALAEAGLPDPTRMEWLSLEVSFVR